MKVLHINCYYLHSTLHPFLIKKIQDLKIDNTVFTPERDLSADYLRCGIDTSLDIRAVECFSQLDRYMYFIKQKKIERAIAENVNVDLYNLIHAHTLFTDGNQAHMLSKKYNIPYIVTVCNTDCNIFFAKRKLLRNVGIRVLNNAEYIIFLSPAYRDTVINTYVPAKYRDCVLQKSIVIPYGIDDYWMENINQNRDFEVTEKRFNNKKLNVIYVGHINKNKNIILTLKALRLLKKEGWRVHFTVVGKILDKQIYTSMERYEFVEFFEQQEKEKLIEFYRRNDIFVMTSHTESFGLVYAEALSQGLPIIYTKGQGFDGQFDNGIVGFATSDSDIKELKANILRCIKDYKKLSQNARQLVKKFDWHDIAQQYKDMYSNLNLTRETVNYYDNK